MKAMSVFGPSRDVPTHPANVCYREYRILESRHDKCLFAIRNRHGLLKISPRFAAARSFYKLLLQFRESRIDPRKYRGLPELREDALCLGQMLKREGTLFLDLVK